MIAVNVWMGSVLLCTVALFLIMRVALLLGNTALYQSSQHKKMRFLLLLELHTPQDVVVVELMLNVLRCHLTH